LPTRPRLDFAFLARLKSVGIPLGLFYRDIYWRFPEYGATLPWWKARAAKLFYWYDLFQYQRLLDRLYLPSMAMAGQVPWVDRACMAALPPGFVDRPFAFRPSAALRLLYVGGLGVHYQMHELFRALEHLPQIEFTLCTRESEWHAVRHEYPLPAAGNIRVVHRSGSDLVELFAEADLCMLFVKPHPYRDFAMPLKLYEYIGAGKPVIASDQTLGADFVQSQGIGWSVPYAASEVSALLVQILNDRSMVEPKQSALRRIKHAHTWQARASQVAADLMESR